MEVTEDLLDLIDRQGTFLLSVVLHECLIGVLEVVSDLVPEKLKRETKKHHQHEIHLRYQR